MGTRQTPGMKAQPRQHDDTGRRQRGSTGEYGGVGKVQQSPGTRYRLSSSRSLPNRLPDCRHSAAAKMAASTEPLLSLDLCRKSTGDAGDSIGSAANHGLPKAYHLNSRLQPLAAPFPSTSQPTGTYPLPYRYPSCPVSTNGSVSQSLVSAGCGNTRGIQGPRQPTSQRQQHTFICSSKPVCCRYTTMTLDTDLHVVMAMDGDRRLSRIGAQPCKHDWICAVHNLYAHHTTTMTGLHNLRT